MRPIGAADLQTITPVRLPQFYRIWTPINFQDRSVFFHVNDEATGNSWITRSVISVDGDSAEEMASLRIDSHLPARVAPSEIGSS